MASMLDSAQPVPAPAAVTPEIRRIGMADVNWALSEGWKDFTAKRGDLIFLGLLYPFVCLLAGAIALNDSLLPLFFPAVAGLSIAGPAVAAGFYELARRREAGLESSWWHFFDPLNGRSRTPLAMLSLGLAVLFGAWLMAAYLIYAATLGQTGAMQIGDIFGRLFTTPEGWAMIVIGHLVGAAFAAVTLVFAFISFPMVVDRSVEAPDAVRTSLAAARRNPGETLGWGLRVGVLLVLGTIPFAIGLAVVLPWLGYATWHLYTRVIVR
ncbi:MULTISPECIES: DUF2189 domain-containing protein [unclassified Sphingomonas]|uniref:DUF2189 domain-containing protein n=2 Tax=Sphingomonas TaxID=13687 RepID=UPI0009EC11A7|nr:MULTISPECIES: DUF2189 domain-containing protein [unclassified Sphingomonas]